MKKYKLPRPSRYLIYLFFTILALEYLPDLSQADCIVGPELLNKPLSNVGSYLQIFTSIRFPCSGKITRWNYFSRAAGTPVYFGVWEAINTTTFRLVDYNRVVPNTTGLIHEDIYDPTEFISVTPGLYLGIHYESIDIPQDRQVIPYADAVKPDPYTVLGLADGFPVGVGHNQIVNSEGYVTFTGILFKNWRLPALQASVKFLIDCGKPPLIPASKVTFKTTLAFSTAVYQCNSGHRLIGSPIATCQSSGLWSPPPICDINDLCFAGPDLYDSALESASSLLQLFPSLQFQCSGFLGRWWFYSRVNSRNVYLAVWRPVPGTNSVKLVGANRILAAHRGLNYFRVPEDDMIFVDPGDFIGIFYERPDLPMTDVVIPYAAEHNLSPYVANDLTETLLLPMGKLDVSSAKGLIDLTKHADGAIAYWRIPAVRGYIISVPLCSQPPLVAYSTIAFSSTKVGAVAVYSCVQGYTLYGQNPIKCLPTQKWSGAPECRLIPRCPEPPFVVNGLAYFNSTSVGAQVTYFCKSGFVVMGQNPLICLTNLTWSLPYPRCQLSSACPPPPILINGQLSMTGTLQPRGAVAFYTCKQGFVMVGASSIFCTNDRTWSTPPTCAPALPVPAQPAPPPNSWGGLTRPWTPPPPPTQAPYLSSSSNNGVSPSLGDGPPAYTTTPAKTVNDGGGDSTTSFVSFNVPTTVSTDTSDANSDSPSNGDASSTSSSSNVDGSGTDGATTVSPDDNGSSNSDNTGLPDDNGLETTANPSGTNGGVEGAATTVASSSDSNGKNDRSTTTSPGGNAGGVTIDNSGGTSKTITPLPQLESSSRTTEPPLDGGTTEEGSILVLTAFNDFDGFTGNLMAAILVPIILIVMIVLAALLFAWCRYRNFVVKEEPMAYGSVRPYYENVKDGSHPGAGQGSLATGYARGSDSGSGSQDQYAGAKYSASTAGEDLYSEASGGSMAMMQKHVPSPLAVTPNAVYGDNNKLTQIKRQPNFFIGAPNGVGMGMPMMTSHRYAGGLVAPPPPAPPPPLPPPPAYRSAGGLAQQPVAATSMAMTYNNTYYASGRATSLHAGRASVEFSTLRRKKS